MEDFYRILAAEIWSQLTPTQKARILLRYYIPKIIAITIGIAVGFYCMHLIGVI